MSIFVPTSDASHLYRVTSDCGTAEGPQTPVKANLFDMLPNTTAVRCFRSYQRIDFGFDAATREKASQPDNESF